MNAPLFSTFTLFTEILVTLAVLYAFYSGYARNRFPSLLVGITLLYETLFNISYMVFRSATHGSIADDTAFEIGLAAFHGILSLVMFVGLFVFMIVAWRHYRKGINYFRAHRALTGTFIVLWLLVVLSGLLFYVITYFK
ncbi:hypothetical protein COX00_04275 [Candidatus Uhrbacteria bacterium CG22_combo_CG10-13_8_21_14_all_47_17]|uniref:DUF420 domain-containing protein n=1 Tax=Candidatus Uhrbacteria bacterium CG22_combo_CG10-13_8_21_14_all_47_17 TaxID=1975041 RepID=A0A2H0BRE5_9BACT|nr:MAG: hypothetical protein COX00_04275 [Candidatus Uhrbacteria bacterium CG22_combo_CG10-13_8_21_14_all_47_17]